MSVISDCCSKSAHAKEIPENLGSDEFSDRVGPGGETITIEI